MTKRTKKLAKIPFFPELVGQGAVKALQAVAEVFEGLVWSESELEHGTPLSVSWDVSEGTLTFESSPSLSGWEGKDDPELLEWLHDIAYTVAEWVAENLQDDGEDDLSQEVVDAFDLD